MRKPGTLQTVIGRHIFVYNNIRTNQVLYSLTKALDNNASLRQLPYLGKKTVPSRLRKDLWQPLATITFPHPNRCLKALRELREFRKLHELSYSLETIQSERSKHELLGKKKRGKRLMDQKANSIADIAAVLIRQENYERDMSEKENAASAGDKEGTGVELTPKIRLGETKVSVEGPATMEERLLDAQPPSEEEASSSADEKEEKGSEFKGVTIRWRNILDAEYAETWPESVMHDGLDWSRNTAPAPPEESAPASPETSASALPEESVPAPPEGSAHHSSEADLDKPHLRPRPLSRSGSQQEANPP